MHTRIRPWWVMSALVASGSVAAPSARAEDPARDIDVLGFAPTTGPGIVTVDSAERLGHLVFRFGAGFGYARDLLIAEGSDRPRYKAVSELMAVDLTAALGLWKYVELGVHLPVAVSHVGEAGVGAGTALSGADVGDLRIVPKIGWGQEDHNGFGIALLPVFTLPTGNGKANSGERGPTFAPKLALSYRFEQGTELALEVGYRHRPVVAFGRLLVGDELTFGAGVNAHLVAGLGLRAEVFGALGLRDNADDPSSAVDEAEKPIEALGALAYDFDFGLGLLAGAGVGLTHGYGAPAYRAFFGITYTFDSKPPPDADLDGIADPDDRCPTSAEDLDGAHDGDGCPDPDNDGDGICDDFPAIQARLGEFEAAGTCKGRDQCTTKVEDKDGFEDGDGCPDEDNDKDGVLDANDQCVDEPEDRDGYMDNDGCPDTDNDGDGILDAADKCPDKPETKNGFEDDDGCPDSSEVKLTDKGIEINDAIYFQLGSAVIDTRSDSLLDKIAQLIIANPQVTKIRVEGHTDDMGIASYNLALSKRRATSVMEALITRGVAADHLASEGFGMTRPVCKEHTTACSSKNRRTEFVLVEVNGKPVP